MNQVYNCVKCTRTQFFAANTHHQAGILAAKAGWIWSGDKLVCPKCAKIYGPPKWQSGKTR